jgi:hypothetical protein
MLNGHEYVAARLGTVVELVMGPMCPTARDELAIEALEALDALGGPRIIGSFDELTDEALAAIELMRSALHAGPAPARDAVATSVHRLDDGGFIRWRPDGVTAFRLGTIRALAPGHARL